MIGKVMKNIGPNIEVESVRLMGELGQVKAVLELPTDQDTKALYEFLNHPSRKGTFTNQRKESIQINYCFDGRRLESENWVCVVLRNLP